jgi:hypothetical protein
VGTAILAREKSERLRGRVDADLLARAARLLIEPGISVVSAALAAANVGEVVHAMHDPTEGGLATGLFELVAPAGLGVWSKKSTGLKRRGLQPRLVSSSPPRLRRSRVRHSHNGNQGQFQGKIPFALTTFEHMIGSTGLGFLDGCGRPSSLFLRTSLPLTKAPVVQADAIRKSS